MAYRCNIEEDIDKFRKMFFKIDKKFYGYLTIDQAKEFFGSYF